MTKNLLSRIYSNIKKWLTRKALTDKLQSIDTKVQLILTYLIINKIAPNIMNELLLPLPVKISSEGRLDLREGRFNYDFPQVAHLRDTTALHTIEMLWRFYSLTLAEVKDVFDYCLNLAVHKRDLVCAQIIQFISYHLAGNPALIFEYFEHFARLPGCWHKRHTKTWAILISALYRVSDNEKALFYLKKHRDIFSLESIPCIPVVALFARKNNMSSNDKITVAAIVQEEIENNRNQKILEKKLGNATIAIVGNAPTDCGKNLASHIDSHDYVFRFGNFQTMQETEYGTKVDFWCTHKSFIPENNINLSAGTNILLTEFEGHFIKWESLYNLYKYIKKQKRQVYALGQDFLWDLIAGTGYWHPSSGLMVGAYLKQVNPGLGRNSFYGFSHKETECHDWGTHYSGSSSAESFSKAQSKFVENPHMKENEMSLKYIFGHNFILEKKLFKSIIG